MEGEGAGARGVAVVWGVCELGSAEKQKSRLISVILSVSCRPESVTLHVNKNPDLFSLGGFWRETNCAHTHNK